MARSRSAIRAVDFRGSRRPHPRPAQPFGSLFDNDFQPILLIDVETSAIVDANRAACAFYGYDLDAFVRLSTADINTSPRAEIEANAKKALAGLKTRFQSQHRLANGEIREVDDWMGPVTVGDRSYLCSIVRDVTEQRQTEASLRASQAMLATAERIARVGSWDWDIVNKTLIWSDEQCRLFGQAPKTFSEKYEGWMGRVHPDDQKRVQAAIDAAVAGERDDAGHVGRVGGADDQRWAAVHAAHEDGARGVVARVLGREDAALDFARGRRDGEHRPRLPDEAERRFRISPGAGCG